MSIANELSSNVDENGLMKIKEGSVTMEQLQNAFETDAVQKLNEQNLSKTHKKAIVENAMRNVQARLDTIKEESYSNTSSLQSKETPSRTNESVSEHLEFSPSSNLETTDNSLTDSVQSAIQNNSERSNTSESGEQIAAINLQSNQPALHQTILKSKKGTVKRGRRSGPTEYNRFISRVKTDLEQNQGLSKGDAYRSAINKWNESKTLQR